MALNKVVGPDPRWHGSCIVGSAGKFQRVLPNPQIRNLDQRGSIDAKLSLIFPLPNPRVRAKLLGARLMVGMLRRKQRGSGDYEVTHDVTVRNR